MNIEKTNSEIDFHQKILALVDNGYSLKCIIEMSQEERDEEFLLLYLSGLCRNKELQLKDVCSIYEINDALHCSASNGHLEVVKYLAEQGADIHADNDCALCWSAYHGHLEIVKYLVEQGADICVHDNYALRSSAVRGHLEVVKYLVEQGADINLLDKEIRKKTMERIEKFLNENRNVIEY